MKGVLRVVLTVAFLLVEFPSALAQGPGPEDDIPDPLVPTVYPMRILCNDTWVTLGEGGKGTFTKYYIPEAPQLHYCPELFTFYGTKVEIVYGNLLLVAPGDIYAVVDDVIGDVLYGHLLVRNSIWTEISLPNTSKVPKQA